MSERDCEKTDGARVGGPEKVPFTLAELYDKQLEDGSEEWVEMLRVGFGAMWRPEW